VALEAHDELETMQACLELAREIDARTLLPRVRRLATHASLAVREKARMVLRTWQEPLPTEVRPPPNPLLPSAVPDARSRPRVRLVLASGEIVLELRPDQAPTTVARFLELVAHHFYDGLTFHRVVPAFVAQAGDPGGDGYGGPGWWQRDEDNRLPFRRGTLGIALAGRDTGGSQFFITLSAQPHLDGRYTAFGAVVSGIDLVDRLLPGDRIVRAELEQPQPTR